jgi:hypothetical protein
MKLARRLTGRKPIFRQTRRRCCADAFQYQAVGRSFLRHAPPLRQRRQPAQRAEPAPAPASPLSTLLWLRSGGISKPTFAAKEADRLQHEAGVLHRHDLKVLGLADMGVAGRVPHHETSSP